MNRRAFLLAIPAVAVAAKLLPPEPVYVVGAWSSYLVISDKIYTSSPSISIPLHPRLLNSPAFRRVRTGERSRFRDDGPIPPGFL